MESDPDWALHLLRKRTATQINQTKTKICKIKPTMTTLPPISWMFRLVVTPIPIPHIWTRKQRISNVTNNLDIRVGRIGESSSAPRVWMMRERDM